jgi:hypothetical protein
VAKIIEIVALYSTDYRTVVTLIDKDPTLDMKPDLGETETRPELDFLDKMRSTQVIVLPDMAVLELDMDNVNELLKNIYSSQPLIGLDFKDPSLSNGTLLKGIVLICAHKV